eukprot:TRINITY_DN408_c0_g1_i3.p1 TRINITY_DN408_c0_g1~~TRINITY_DN408_c0_g1_i3.p1  ORF type:complete len:193 (-),score=51.72 TRINITY_DN408_c0_g1_i3:421-999(-)
MKVVGQRLSETLKAQSSVNSLTKALVIIANLIIHEDTNPEFISMIAKWRPGFVKLSEVYSIDAVGEVDVGVKVRQLATSVVEILDDALLEEPQQEDNKPPAYHEEAGEQEEENKQLEGEVEVSYFVQCFSTNDEHPSAYEQEEVCEEEEDKLKVTASRQRTCASKEERKKAKGRSCAGCPENANQVHSEVLQ